MKFVLKIQNFGDETGVILPPELLTHSEIQEDDELIVSESEDAEFRVGVKFPSRAHVTKTIKKVIRDYRGTLSALAEHDCIGR